MAPVSAAPVLSNAAALKSAIENPITEVRYIRRGVARRGVARAAVATGVGLAAAASSRQSVITFCLKFIVFPSWSHYYSLAW
jgi:hypothetical protein